MSAVVVNDVRPGFYLDSVALMRLSREIEALAGVERAAVMMATPSNKAILADAGLLEPRFAEARGNDLLITLSAATAEAAEAALAAARLALDKPRARSRDEQGWRPRSIAAAVRELPEANLALISVPGDFAAGEARKALRRGLHVLLFSDNVGLADERELKQEACERGLLMMGPDCGTAILGGVPLAFANRVERGAIGIVGASGTGIQEVSCLVSRAGSGISHAIGVGGRDLKGEIGGLTTLAAIDALDADPGTGHIVLISKPPHPEVARRVSERIARSAKPFTVCFIGAGAVDLPANATAARTLSEAAEHAAGRAVEAAPASAGRLNGQRPGGWRIEGLFSGGTLCAEAQIVLSAGGRQVVSNAPVPGVGSPAPGENRHCDRILDLGADEYTRGRPHPMIDPTVRDELLQAALADPATAVVLVDVVIGYGAHADPAGHLAGVIAGRPHAAPPVVASVTGTEADPQVRSAQVERLEREGVIVAPSNARASELALAIATREG